MGRRILKNGEERMTMHVYLTDKAHIKLKKLAGLEGLSLSAYIMKLIEQEAGKIEGKTISF